MAATLVQSSCQDTNSITNGSTLAFGSNVTAGNTLIVLIAWYTAFAPSITDSQGNTWTRSAATAVPGSLVNSFYVFTAVAGSSAACTLTFSAAGGSNILGSSLSEVSGLAASPLDQKNANANSSSPVDAGAITTTANGEYIACLFSRGTVNSSYTSGASFVVEATSPTNSANAYADFVQTTAGSITPSINSGGVSSSYKVIGFCASFKAAVASNLAAAFTSTATTTGLLGGSGSMNAHPAATATEAATLTGSGALIAAVTGTATGNYVLAGSGSLRASITGTATGIYGLGGTGSLLSAITGTATTAAVLGGTGSLIASISGLGTVVASGTLFGFRSSNITGAATIAATLLGSGSVIAAVNGTASVSAILKGSTSLASALTGTNTIAAVLTGTGTLSILNGTIGCSASLVSGITGTGFPFYYNYGKGQPFGYGYPDSTGFGYNYPRGTPFVYKYNNSE